MNWKRVPAVALGLCVSVVLIGSGIAAETEREPTMKHIGRAVKALGTMAKSGNFDQAVAAKQGNAIAGYFDQFKTMFPQGSEKADSKALPAIWTDRAGFEITLGQAKAAALGIAKSTDAASFQAALNTLGGTCRSCHDKYRAD